MGMETLCNGKKAPLYGNGDTLHWQKVPHIQTCEHFALAKRPQYMGIWTLCIGKKAPIYRHGDTLKWQKGPFMGMGTLCAAKKVPMYGHGDPLSNCPKRPIVFTCSPSELCGG